MEKAGDMIAAVFATDEELGKKDDDHKPGRIQWAPAKGSTSLRWRRRRVVYVALGLLMLWALYMAMPPGFVDMPSPLEGPGRAPAGSQKPPPRFAFNPDAERSRFGGSNPPSPPPPPPKLPSKSKPGDAVTEFEHYYEGPILFSELPVSLRDVARTLGHRSKNRNVLFAASSLKSMSVILPIACDMGKLSRNFVHVAFFGRTDLLLGDILEINGVDKSECNIYWHDARPDYAAYSTDARVESAVVGAFRYMARLMHPQVTITDSLELEDNFFGKGLKYAAAEFSVPLIELPAGQPMKFGWLTRLDVRALRDWHKSQIDILVQAPRDSTGSLLRLLTSLYMADYAGFTLPRLTIELPPDMDDMTKTYLSNYRWPPSSGVPSTTASSQITYRHRIPNKLMTPEEASVRFLESFYPHNGAEDHVLVLSANTQLSPLYFHYLKYHLLEYRSSGQDYFSNSLLGFSLELPTQYMNGSGNFIAPLSQNPSVSNDGKEESKALPKGTSPFLWQAPNTNAALYFGDKWIELHSFVTHRLAKFQSSNTTPAKQKTVSSTLPAWAEYFAEYMRCRGYSLLYPGSFSSISQETQQSLVTLHSESYTPPEEFLRPPPSATVDAHEEATRTPDADPFLYATASPSPDISVTPHPQPRIPNFAVPLQNILPSPQDTLDLIALPHLFFDGTRLTKPNEAETTSLKFAEEFRQGVGGCAGVKAPEEMTRKLSVGSARDLFCYGGEDKDPGAWMRDTKGAGGGFEAFD